MTPAARLGDPLDLKADVRLRNRIVATAHGSGAIADGLPVAGDAEYWGRVAAGGAAMVITGGTVVSADSTVRRGNFTEAWRPEVKPGLRRRADAIHAAGAVALVQLVHLGRETLGAERYYAPVAPSAVRSRREPTAPRALGDAEIATLVQAHRVSAEHALETGFDGIELHAAHGYLLAQFLSPVANRRPSARDAAGRAEPVWRIVEAIRDAGPSTLIGIRLSVGDAHDAGLDLEQLGELLALLPPSVDYVNLTVGMRGSYVRDMATEQPPLLADVAALRALTDRPLLVAQAFRDPVTMQRALAAGADLVGVARALIADPDLPLKVLTGRAQEVRPCVACNEDCRTFEPTLLCTVNPDLAPPGQPSRPAEPLIVGARAPAPARRVGVVGAGPAGLECALTLARAGDCEVVVWERETDVGGALATAAGGPASPGLARVARLLPRRAAGGWGDAAPRRGSHRRRICRRATRSSSRAAPRRCCRWSATAGFASTSSEALTAGPERLRGAAHLVVVDDGFGWWPSVSAVELGVAAGVERITLVTPGVAFAMGIPAESRTQLLPRLTGIRLDIRPLTSLAGFGDGSVALRPAGGGAAERVEADAVIVVGERRPRDWAPLVADLPGAIVIGDAIVPRRIAHAIAEGRAAARALLDGSNRADQTAVTSPPLGLSVAPTK